MKRSLRFLFAVFGPVALLAIGVEVARKFAPRMGVVGDVLRVDNPPGSTSIGESFSLPTLTLASEYISPFKLKDPVDLVASGNWLVVLDPFGEHGAVAFDSRVGSWSDLRKALELSPRHQLQRGGSDGVDGHFLLMDADRGRRVIELTLPLGTSSPSLLKFSTPLGRGAGGVLSDRNLGVVWGFGFDSAALLTRYKRHAGSLHAEATFGSPLFPEFQGTSIANALHRSAVAMNPVTGAVVQAFLFSNRISTYTPEGRPDRHIAGPLESRLAFSTKSDLPHGEARFVMSMDTRFTYLDVSANETHIYALYSGRQARHSMGTGGTELHVFTWDGRFLGRWRLPQSTLRLKLAGRPEYLWAIQGPPTVGVRAYSIPLPPSPGQ